MNELHAHDATVHVLDLLSDHRRGCPALNFVLQDRGCRTRPPAFSFLSARACFSRYLSRVPRQDTLQEPSQGGNWRRRGASLPRRSRRYRQFSSPHASAFVSASLRRTLDPVRQACKTIRPVQSGLCDAQTSKTQTYHRQYLTRGCTCRCWS